MRLAGTQLRTAGSLEAGNVTGLNELYTMAVQVHGLSEEAAGTWNTVPRGRRGAKVKDRGRRPISSEVQNVPRVPREGKFFKSRMLLRLGIVQIGTHAEWEREPRTNFQNWYVALTLGSGARAIVNNFVHL